MSRTCASAEELNRGTNNKHRGLMSDSEVATGLLMYLPDIGTGRRVVVRSTYTPIVQQASRLQALLARGWFERKQTYKIGGEFIKLSNGLVTVSKIAI